MFQSIFTKTLYGQRWQLLGWVLGIGSIVLMTMVLYPSFSQQGTENIVDSVPESLRSLVGDINDFKTVSGYIGQQIFGPNLYIISLIMSILIFLGVSASEEVDGRLQSLLSFPVSRTKVYFQKYASSVIVLGVISLAVVLAIAIALVAIGETADWSRIWQSTFAFTLINLVYGTLAFAVAFLTGSRTFTLLIVAGYTVASFFITTLAPAVDKLATIDKFSLLHYYNNPQIMTHGLNGPHIWLLIGVTLGLLLVGWFGFLRRDVKAS